MKLNTKWKQLVWTAAVWSCSSSRFDTSRLRYQTASGINNISAEMHSTSSFRRQSFFRSVFWLYACCGGGRGGTWGRTDKRRSEGERKKGVSRWDYVFMNVLRPIGEMGAVPGNFSRPPSMACPHLVKSGSLLNGDTHTHTQAHARRAKHPGSADWVELKSCRVTAALRHNSTALNNGGCNSMRAAVAAWCLFDWVCINSKSVSIFTSAREMVTQGVVRIGTAVHLLRL